MDKTINATIAETARKKLSEFLPDAISQALKSYYKFSQTESESTEPKEFSEHHKACKIAIAHIELLIKLAKWAELPDSNAGNNNHQATLAAMMEQAQIELADYKARQTKSNKP